MTFNYPTLAVVGAALAVLPIVIHLLNRFRRRRVAWAAMDFLLQSDRKNRTWVKLSEWLLLASRVAAIALAGLLAATPQAADLLEGFFGADRALHLVLLDDTASMQRREAGSTAWDEAADTVHRLLEAAERSGDRVVLARYTDVLAGRETVAPAAEGPAGLDAWRPTNAGASPIEGLDRLSEARAEAEDASRVYAYVLSDFAETDHGERGGWADSLRALSGSCTETVLAACGDPASGNLAIETLALAPGPVAAGVETRLLVEVVNHADEPAAPVSVALRRGGQPLMAVEIGPFEPRGRRRVEAPISFGGVGLHVLEAELPGDRLPADDRRWLAVETPAAQQVLLVDNSEREIESRVVAAALRPLGKARSGWAPVRVAAPTAEDLAEAAAVMVLDVDRLTPAALRSLRDYVAMGGGAFWSCGPRTDADWFNRRVAGGLASADSLVPWRLGPPTSAPVVAAGEPSLRVAGHFATRVIAGEGNGFLPLIRVAIRRRLATDEESPSLREVSTSRSTGADALLSFVNGDPLLLENRYGEGRVAAMLTTFATGAEPAPPWSNLVSLPILPVFVNDLTGWLAQGRLASEVESIGSVEPSGSRTGELRVWRPTGEFESTIGLGPAAALAPAEPGVFKRIGRDSGEPFAAVIDPSESDLRAADLASLRSRWGDVARVGRAAEMFRDKPTPAGRVPLYAVASCLLAACVIERGLAYRNSYLTAAAPAQGATG